jgi:hypothetical protein
MRLVPNQNAHYGQLILLAPPQVSIPGSFARVEESSHLHEHLLHGIQRLRARIYREDGAIHESEISEDGRHLHPADERAWHLLSLDQNEEVCGCSRYVEHPNAVAFSQLGVRKVPLALSWEWSQAFRNAIDSEIAEARRRSIAYVEVGGWALDPAMRGAVEAVRIALATYGLARILGGCIGLTTATRRHCSAAILRKIGGRRLRLKDVELPPYYDPQYDCEMELLRFDSAEPNPRFEPWVQDLRDYLTGTLVVHSKARPEDPSAVRTHVDREAPQHQGWSFGQDLIQAVH